MANLVPKSVLLEQGLLNWSSLVVGWNHKWLSRDDVIQFAVSWLITHPDDDDKSIAFLAGSESSSEGEIRDCLCQVAQRLEQFDLAEQRKYHRQMEKWRYAHLSFLQQAELSDTEKIDRLQILYAHFGYPEDMAGCSKYGPGPDPLEAMASAVEHLRTIVFRDAGS